MGGHEVTIVAGLGFGDEGKGTVTEFLAHHSRAHTVVRYNGGPQAAHHVVRPNGAWHCFSQFGSGSFLPGVRTHLSRSMLVKPSNLFVERDALRRHGLEQIEERLTVDPGAYLVTPWHALLGRMEECARGAQPHGSVGMGVGKAAGERRERPEESLQLKDCLDAETLRRKLACAWDRIQAQAGELKERAEHGSELSQLYRELVERTPPTVMFEEYRRAGEMLAGSLLCDGQFGEQLPPDAGLVLEGAQGALLDYERGFSPHVTKTDTTFSSARPFILNAGLVSARCVKVGVLRAYGTRHGAGPFVAENSKLVSQYPEQHNATHRWQGAFRVGCFDLVASRYALRVSGGADELALTHLDTVGRHRRVFMCESYRYIGDAGERELREYFDVERSGNEIILHSMHVRPPGNRAAQDRLTQLLKSCVPHRCTEYAGWGGALPRRAGDIPDSLKRWLDRLECRAGLGCPVRLLSFGPTVDDKLVLD